MKPLPATLLSALLGLAAASAGAQAPQAQTQTQALQRATRPCPAANAVAAAQLHGLWTVQWDDGTPAGRLRLGPHPEYPGSLDGQLRQRGAGREQVSRVVGDLDAGTLSLEESHDGVSTSGSWDGTLVDASCGSEIRGRRSRFDSQTETAFVMRKLASAATPSAKPPPAAPPATPATLARPAR